MDTRSTQHGPGRSTRNSPTLKSSMSGEAPEPDSKSWGLGWTRRRFISNVTRCGVVVAGAIGGVVGFKPTPAGAAPLEYQPCPGGGGCTHSGFGPYVGYQGISCVGFNSYDPDLEACCYNTGTWRIRVVVICGKTCRYECRPEEILVN